MFSYFSFGSQSIHPLKGGFQKKWHHHLDIHVLLDISAKNTKNKRQYQLQFFRQAWQGKFPGDKRKYSSLVSYPTLSPSTSSPTVATSTSSPFSLVKTKGKYRYFLKKYNKCFSSTTKVEKEEEENNQVQRKTTTKNLEDTAGTLSLENNTSDLGVDLDLRQSIPLFSSHSPTFFRLLTLATSIQVVFWSVYQTLPPLRLNQNLATSTSATMSSPGEEIIQASETMNTILTATGANDGNLGLIGIAGSCGFLWLVNQFAQKYVAQLDLHVIESNSVTATGGDGNPIEDNNNTTGTTSKGKNKNKNLLYVLDVKGHTVLGGIQKEGTIIPLFQQQKKTSSNLPISSSVSWNSSSEVNIQNKNTNDQRKHRTNQIKKKGKSNYVTSVVDTEDSTNFTDTNNASIITGYTGDLEVVESLRYIAFKRRNKDNFYFLLDINDGKWFPFAKETGKKTIAEKDSLESSNLITPNNINDDNTKNKNKQAQDKTKALMMGFLHPVNLFA